MGSKSDALASVGRLPEEVQASVKRFFKGSSNAYDEFIVEHLSNGNYLVKMKKPGNVPGSKAIYYKEIGADGSSLKAYMLLCQDLVQIKMRTSPCYCLANICLVFAFVLIWGQIIAMAVNAYGVIKCLDVLKNQTVCMSIISNFHTMQPLTFDERMK